MRVGLADIYCGCACKSTPLIPPTFPPPVIAKKLSFTSDNNAISNTLLPTSYNNINVYTINLNSVLDYFYSEYNDNPLINLQCYLKISNNIPLSNNNNIPSNPPILGMKICMYDSLQNIIFAIQSNKPIIYDNNANLFGFNTFFFTFDNPNQLYTF